MDIVRLLARLALAGLELTLLGLALVLTQLLDSTAPVPVALLGLATALLVGAAVTLLTQRWEQSRRMHLLGMLVVIGVCLLLIKGGLGGGYGPLGGWEALAHVLLGQGDPRFGGAYLALVLALLAGWRGTQLRAPTVPAEVQQRFKRGLLVLVALVLAAVLLPIADPATARRAASGASIGYVVAGLLAQALFRETSAERSDRRFSARKLLLLLGAIGAPLTLTLALASWVSADAAALIGQVYLAIVQGILIIITPIVMVLFGILEALFRLLRSAGGSTPVTLLPTAGPTPALPNQTPAVPLFLPVWLTTFIGLLPYLVPLVLLVLLMLLRSRRTAPEVGPAEERESVWSWRTAGQDLRAWWDQLQRRLARPERDVLAAALARLRGDDPVMVIRRAYVRLLMCGVQMGRARAPEQTPAEYEREVLRLFPARADAVETLTRSYERARYHPAAVTSAQAADAQKAWERLVNAPPRGPDDES